MANIFAFDYGSKRIGIARANDVARIAQSLTTIEADGDEIEQIARLIADYDVTELVVGLPRGAEGQLTKQSEAAEAFARQLEDRFQLPVRLQDESLTSVLARNEIGQVSSRDKGKIDMRAAELILTDYLEQPIS